MIRAAALLAACLPVGTVAAQPVPEPSGYHGEPYRGPVPATLAGARVLDAGGVARAIAAGAVAIDVLPQVRKPPDLPAGTIWRDPDHPTIPGAVRLPGTGYDRLTPDQERDFALALARLSGGRRDAVLIFFCKRDCWMGWNAARRAVGLGYSGVAWFPGGTEDWAAAGLPLDPP